MPRNQAGYSSTSKDTTPPSGMGADEEAMQEARLLGQQLEDQAAMAETGTGSKG